VRGAGGEGMRGIFVAGGKSDGIFVFKRGLGCEVTSDHHGRFRDGGDIRASAAAISLH